MRFCLFCIITLVLQLKVQGFTIVTNANAPDWVDGNYELMNLNAVGGSSYTISGGGVEGVWLSTSPYNAIINTWTLQVDTATIAYGTSAIVSYSGEEINQQSFSDNQSRVLLNQNSQGNGFSSVQVTQSQFYITSGTGAYGDGYDFPVNRTHWGWGLFEINYSGELTLLDSYSIWDTRFYSNDYNGITYPERLDGIVTGEESFLIVPEPSTYALFLGGAVLGYAFWRRRK